MLLYINLWMIKSSSWMNLNLHLFASVFWSRNMYFIEISRGLFVNDMLSKHQTSNHKTRKFISIYNMSILRYDNWYEAKYYRKVEYKINDNKIYISLNIQFCWNGVYARISDSYKWATCVCALNRKEERRAQLMMWLYLQNEHHYVFAMLRATSIDKLTRFFYMLILFWAADEAPKNRWWWRNGGKSFRQHWALFFLKFSTH